jgi:hypothetical protein
MTSVITEDRGTVEGTIKSFLVPEGRELTPGVGAEVARAPQLQSRNKKHLARITRSARLTLAAEIVHQLRGVLGDDLLKLLLAGMKTHTALCDAARTTLREPGTSIPVHLAGHTVHTQHTVEVTVVGPVFRVVLPFELSLDFDVLEADAKVDDGRVRELVVRDPTVTGTVHLHGRQVYDQKGVLATGGHLTLGEGLQILSDPEERTLRGPGPT